jgi:hypothetical protein
LKSDTNFKQDEHLKLTVQGNCFPPLNTFI